MTYVFLKKKDGKCAVLKKETRQEFGIFDSKEDAQEWLKLKNAGKKLSLRGRQALKNFGENGGNWRKALKDAGYSQKMADNPKMFTESKAFKNEFPKMMDQLGLTDRYLIRKHLALSTAVKVMELSFPHNWRYEKRKKSRGKGTYQEKVWEPVSDETIIEAVNKIPHSNLIYIGHHAEKKLAHYTAPDTNAVKEAVNLAYKNKGYFAPEHISLDTHHELTPEEKKELDDILKNNE